MLVKKLKSGKLRVELDLDGRNNVFYWLMNILEGNFAWVERNRLKKEQDIYLYLNYCVLNELLVRPNWYLQTNTTKKIVITKAEAVALMWLLRNQRDMHSLNLKSALHKSLI
jgi:hypothetical protein